MFRQCIGLSLFVALHSFSAPPVSKGGGITTSGRKPTLYATTTTTYAECLNEAGSLTGLPITEDAVKRVAVHILATKLHAELRGAEFKSELKLKDAALREQQLTNDLKAANHEAEVGLHKSSGSHW